MIGDGGVACCQNVGATDGLDEFAEDVVDEEDAAFGGVGTGFIFVVCFVSWVVRKGDGMNKESRDKRIGRGIKNLTGA